MYLVSPDPLLVVSFWRVLTKDLANYTFGMPEYQINEKNGLNEVLGYFEKFF